MPALLVLVFVLVPLLEVFVILQVGGALGAAWTVALLVATGIAGAWLLKVEGRRAWSQFRAALAEGRWPGEEVAQGGLVIVGGTLLVTPGFITDAIGFLLLLGPTRRMVSSALRGRVGRRRARDAAPRRGAARRGSSPQDLRVEVVEIEREQPAPGRIGTEDPVLDGEPPGEDDGSNGPGDRSSGGPRPPA